MSQCQLVSLPLWFELLIEVFLIQLFFSISTDFDSLLDVNLYVANSMIQKMRVCRDRSPK